MGTEESVFEYLHVQQISIFFNAHTRVLNTTQSPIQLAIAGLSPQFYRPGQEAENSSSRITDVSHGVELCYHFASACTTLRQSLRRTL